MMSLTLKLPYNSSKVSCFFCIRFQMEKVERSMICDWTSIPRFLKASWAGPRKLRS